MTTQHAISEKTHRNWIVDLSLMISALLCSVSGIYFLFAPHGGFRGGRNAVADTFLGLDRGVWKEIHTYTGLIMIAIAVYHILLHWDWIMCTIKRAWRKIGSAGDAGNGWTNVFVDVIALVTFFVTAVSGIYFYLAPHGGPRAGQNAQMIFLFSRWTWNWLHQWIGLAFIMIMFVHFLLHWDWVVRVTRKMIRVTIHPKTTFPSMVD